MGCGKIFARASARIRYFRPYLLFSSSYATVRCLQAWTHQGIARVDNASGVVGFIKIRFHCCRKSIKVSVKVHLLTLPGHLQAPMTTSYCYESTEDVWYHGQVGLYPSDNRSTQSMMALTR